MSTIYDNVVKADEKTVKANYENLKNIVINEIETNNIYERFFQIEPDKVVVDVGAHIGVFAKKAVEKGARVYAIEPSPMFLKDLKKIEGLNVSEVAISSQEGESRIEEDGNPNEIGEGGTVIKTTTFPKFVADNNIEHIDFLKLDCEGGEYDIFTPEGIKWVAKNVTKVAGELHIVTKERRKLVPKIVEGFKKEGIDILFTSVNGIILKTEEVLKRLNYYHQVLFYFRTDADLVLPEDVKPFQQLQQCNYHFVNGCYVELTGYPEDVYNIEFINSDTGQTMHTGTIPGNGWARCNYQYFVPWRIIISKIPEPVEGDQQIEEGEIVESIDLDLKDQRVLISLDSKSLGDTLAWMPYAEEFQKKHECQVILSTFMNDLFEDTYPELEFVPPGTTVHNIRAMYNIGWFYSGDQVDFYRNPTDFKKQPMQKTATDVLGLEYEEIKPRLILPDVERTDTVGIGFHSTAQVKYWNNPKGWQEVVNFINSKGHVPLIMSREEDGYMGNKFPRGVEKHPAGSVNKLIGALCRCKAFVGVGSGISWLAWACNVPTILISGFSEPYTELQPSDTFIRIGAPKREGLTSGCFNKYRFDPGDWHWYEPAQLVDTDRQYECSKAITSEEVIEALKKFI